MYQNEYIRPAISILKQQVGTGMLSRNFGNKLSIYVAEHPRRAKAQFSIIRANLSFRGWQSLC